MPSKPNLRFLDASGEMAELMRGHDWSRSPLGPPARWPQSLRGIVRLMLSSKFPMFVAWGPDLGFLYNDPYSEILGGKHPAALGRPFQEVWAEIWDDIGPLAQRALAGEATFMENMPLRMRRLGFDEATWFTFSYSPVVDDDGEIVGMYCACTETTEAVLASQRREDENDRLRQLFQQAPGIIGVLRGEDHVFEIANDAYVELAGGRRLVGLAARDALPEVEGQGLFELLDDVYRTGKPFIGRGVPVMLARGGSGALEERFVDFIYQPVRDHHGRITGIFVEGSDVTEAVRATVAVRESEARLRHFANGIRHLAWIAGADGRLQWCNDRWSEFSGRTREALQGDGWLELLDAVDTSIPIAAWKMAIAAGMPFETTVRLRGRDGASRLFQVHGVPFRDASGQVVQWFGTHTDITDVQAAQDALEDANRRKDEFLAMLAHELRNPLAPISTSAQMLRLLGTSDPRVLQASEVIARQSAHMVELVDDLLDVSRVTRGLVELERAPIELASVVAEAVEQVRPLVEARGHALATALDGSHPRVLGDRTRLIQVVSNLLSNAAKYTPPGGNIRLRVGTAGGGARVEVEDDGAGIADDLLPRIFTLFAQGVRTPDRAQGGLGIGLSLARSLVELHGGTIEAFSDGPRRGARFVVTLPLHAGAGADEEACRPPAADVTATGRVLLVDDNVDAAQSLAELLGLVGYEVCVRGDGESALRIADEEHFDAFVLDIGLPGMDGYELARRLRATPGGAEARLVALTGYGQPQDRARSANAGFDLHLVKPADPARLIAALAPAAEGAQGA